MQRKQRLFLVSWFISWLANMLKARRLKENNKKSFVYFVGM